MAKHQAHVNKGMLRIGGWAAHAGEVAAVARLAPEQEQQQVQRRGGRVRRGGQPGARAPAVRAVWVQPRGCRRQQAQPQDLPFRRAWCACTPRIGADC